MSISKEKVRQRCIDLGRDIRMMERNGEYGRKVWHAARNALDRAISAYRELGATNSEVIHIGLHDWAEKEKDHG